MEINLVSKKPDSTDIVAGLFAASEVNKHPLLKTLSKEDLSYLSTLAKKVGLDNDKHQVAKLPSNPDRSVLLLGLGKKSDWSHRKMMLTARKIVSLSKGADLKQISINLKDFEVRGKDITELMSLLVQNALHPNVAFSL